MREPSATIRLASLVLVACLGSARAEVADKVPSTTWLWGAAMAFVLAAAVLERVRPRLGLIVVPFAAAYAATRYLELSSSDVGPAIRAEIGSAHLVAAYAALLAAVVGSMAAVLLGRGTPRR